MSLGEQNRLWASWTHRQEVKRTLLEGQVNIVALGRGVLQNGTLRQQVIYALFGSTLYLVLSWAGLIPDLSSVMIPITLSCKGYQSFCVLWNSSCTAGHNKQSIVMFTMIMIFQMPFI